MYARKIDVSATVEYPRGLAISIDGNVHVASSYSSKYAVLTPAGKPVRSHEFANTYDVTIDVAGFAFPVRHTNNINS